MEIAHRPAPVTEACLSQMSLSLIGELSSRDNSTLGTQFLCLSVFPGLELHPFIKTFQRFSVGTSFLHKIKKIRLQIRLLAKTPGVFLIL